MPIANDIKLILSKALKKDIPLSEGRGELFHLSAVPVPSLPSNSKTPAPTLPGTIQNQSELSYADIELISEGAGPNPHLTTIIHDMFTEPGARGLGLGTKLLQESQKQFPHSTHWIASTSPEMDSLATKTGFSLSSKKGLSRKLPESTPAEVSYPNANIWKKVVPAIPVVAGDALLNPAPAPAQNSKGSKFDLSPGLTVRANVPVGNRDSNVLPRHLVEGFLDSPHLRAGEKMEFSGKDWKSAVDATIGRVAGSLVLDPVTAVKKLGEGDNGESWNPVRAAMRFLEGVGSSVQVVDRMLGGKSEKPEYFDAAMDATVLSGLASSAGKGMVSFAKGLGEAGEIRLPGFYSKLTEALKAGGNKKNPITPKMTGERVINNLVKMGISPDELNYTGVGNVLREIGNAPIGESRLADLVKMADENALGFEKEVSKGRYPQYSLFKDSDKSFVNTVYRYPGVKFKEAHFGEGVVAHRRGGDKVLKTEGGDIDALHIDEVQSQFYEKGSVYGHGEAGKSNVIGGERFVDELIKVQSGQVGSSKMSQDIKKYADLSEEIKKYQDRADLSPEEMANSLELRKQSKDIFDFYTREREVPEDIPLQGTKYIELVLKDALQEAISKGKSAISWTPSSLQSERYYGRHAMGRLSWSYPGNGAIEVNLPNGRRRILDTIEHLDKTVGASNRKAIISALKSGVTEGSLDKAPNEVYQKIYDKAIPKVMEKLTGEKARIAKTTDNADSEVDVFYVPLDKIRPKMIKSEDEITEIVKASPEEVISEVEKYRTEFIKQNGEMDRVILPLYDSSYDAIYALRKRRSFTADMTTRLKNYEKWLEEDLASGRMDDIDYYRTTIDKLNNTISNSIYTAKYLNGVYDLIRSLERKKVKRKVIKTHPSPIASKKLGNDKDQAFA